MSTLTRREYRGPLGDMVDWLEAPWAVLRPMTGHLMRVEDFVQDGSYVVRAELPGIDPEKDVEVTVANGILTIKAERREEADRQAPLRVPLRHVQPQRGASGRRRRGPHRRRVRPRHPGSDGQARRQGRRAPAPGRSPSGRTSTSSQPDAPRPGQARSASREITSGGHPAISRDRRLVFVATVRPPRGKAIGPQIAGQTPPLRKLPGWQAQASRCAAVLHGGTGRGVLRSGPSGRPRLCSRSGSTAAAARAWSPRPSFCRPLCSPKASTPRRFRASDRSAPGLRLCPSAGSTTSRSGSASRSCIQTC